MKITFSIRESGHLIPNDTEWFTRITGLSSIHICANPTNVILSACAFAIEMEKLLRSHYVSESDTSLTLPFLLREDWTLASCKIGIFKVNFFHDSKSRRCIQAVHPLRQIWK